MSTSVPVDAPWTAPKAAEWDGQTLETVDQGATASTERFRRLVPAVTRPVFGAEPRELSAAVRALLHRGLRATRPTPAPSSATSTPRTAPRCTASRAARRGSLTLVAAQLGRRVVLSAPVRRIAQTADGVRGRARRPDGRAPSGRSSRSRRRSPAGSTTRPPLPAARDQLTQRLGQGTLTKVTAVYDTPFWRAQGLTGHGGRAPTAWSTRRSTTRPRAARPACSSASSAATAPAPTSASTPPPAAPRCSTQLATLFGPAGARARAPSTTPAGRTSAGRAAARWRSPARARCSPTATGRGPHQGRIHFAGTETSTFWNGYMDGAVALRRARRRRGAAEPEAPTRRRGTRSGARSGRREGGVRLGRVRAHPRDVRDLAAGVAALRGGLRPNPSGPSG